MPEHFPRIHDEWRQGKITTKQAIEILELKPTTFYRLVKRYESK